MNTSQQDTPLDLRYRLRDLVNRSGPLWIFGYGSLLFRPGFPFEERRTAFVQGFARRFEQGSPDHRGTPSRLGRVLTLLKSPGASCAGAVFRVHADHAASVLKALDQREQGGYERVELECALFDHGTTVKATTWIAPPDNPYYLGPAPLETMAAQIRQAEGPSGTNVDYVFKVAEVLRSLGVVDPHVEEVAAALGGCCRGDASGAWLGSPREAYKKKKVH